jgi:acyl-CoA thioesterase II
MSTFRALLTLQPQGGDAFVGESPNSGWRRVFGGQLLAQALIAACATAPAPRQPHVLQAMFIHGVDPMLPIVYRVERVREGRTFSTRRVLVEQKGRLACQVMVSFQDTEEGVEHAHTMPDVPPPESLVDFYPINVPDPIDRDQSPLHMRPVPAQTHGTFHVWAKMAEHLTDVPFAAQAILAFASDLTLLDTAAHPHGTTIFAPHVEAASLDHSLWFHRAALRPDAWLLFAQESPSTHNHRGFARGQVFDENGRLLASTAQEGLMRIKKHPTFTAGSLL